MTDIKTVTLQDLLGRIEVLEKEIKKLTGKDTEKVKPAPASADVKTLLEELDTAKEKDDKKLAFTIRKKLRKAGYSLRDNNGK